MPYYAQIDADRRCTSVTETAGPISGDNLIELDSYDTSLLGRPHDAATGEWGALPPAPAPEWEWFIDVGPFTDRLGAASAAIDVSTLPGLVAIRSDFSRRKWIDLKDPRVIAAVHYLAGQLHPVLGTLDPALLTATQADMVLNTTVQPADNLALRKVYFNA